MKYIVEARNFGEHIKIYKFLQLKGGKSHTLISNKLMSPQAHHMSNKGQTNKKQQAQKGLKTS